MGLASVGIAQAAYEASVKYARERVQFGKPIGKFQLIQEMLYEMRVSIETARLLGYKAMDLIVQGNPEARLYSAMAKAYGGEVAQRVTTLAIQIHGGLGISEEMPLESVLPGCADDDHSRRDHRDDEADFGLLHSGQRLLRLQLKARAGKIRSAAGREKQEAGAGVFIPPPPFFPVSSPGTIPRNFPLSPILLAPLPLLFPDLSGFSYFSVPIMGQAYFKGGGTLGPKLSITAFRINGLTGRPF